MMPGRSGRKVAAAWLGLAVMPGSALAQDASLEQDDGPITAEEALYNADEMWKLNPQAEEEGDSCEQPTDPDVIVICRESVDPERYMFERTGDRRPGAEHRTTGSGLPRVDLNDSCLNTRGRKNCNIVGNVPPPTIEVDFEAFPETPAGSAAARWGGPTDADTIAANENRVGADRVPQPDANRPDIGIETQRGIEDDVYGP